MGNRNISFTNGEFYHVYNRGVDKRDVFMDEYDRQRFFESMESFNTIDPIGSIYEQSFSHDSLGGSTSKIWESKEPLVNIIAYCLNPNHFHFLLEQVEENGVSKFMHRLGGGYTMYFNEKYDRSGALFQGRFKAAHVYTNEYLLHVSAYVNLNYRVHQLGGSTSKSSWEEYVGDVDGVNFCKKSIILEQFENKEAYKTYAEDALGTMLDRKQKEKEIALMAIE